MEDLNLKESIVPVETDIFKELLVFAQKKYNVLLIGDHGIGKTEIMKQICVYLGLTYIYLSASTLDPYTDLIGIPAPEHDEILKKKVLKYIRDNRLEHANIIILDEINRSHHKVRNACFEMVQFKSLQGVRLPNLEMVWAGCNNPDTEMNYAVEEMDPPMIDRFHAYVRMEANPDARVYASKGIPLKKAEKAIAWWSVLQKHTKRFVTPRRLEYLLRLHMDGTDLKYGMPPEGFYKNIGEIPLNTLHESLSSEMDAEELKEEYKDYTPEWMEESYQEAINTSYQSPDLSFHMLESVKKFKNDSLEKVIHVVKKFSPEFQNSMVQALGPKLDKDASKLKKKFPKLMDWLVETRKNNQDTINNVNPNVQHNVTTGTATVNSSGQITNVKVDDKDSTKKP